MNKRIESLLMLLSVLMSMNRNGCVYFYTNISLKINQCPLSPQAPPCLPSAKGNTSLVPVARRGSKKISDLRVTGLCEGNTPMTGGFPSQRASNAENVSIWWHYHVSRQLGWRQENSCAMMNNVPKKHINTPTDLNYPFAGHRLTLYALNILRKHNKYSCIS